MASRTAAGLWAAKLRIVHAIPPEILRSNIPRTSTAVRSSPPAGRTASARTSTCSGPAATPPAAGQHQRVARAGGDPLAEKRRAKGTRPSPTRPRVLEQERVGWRSLKHAHDWARQPLAIRVPPVRRTPGVGDQQVPTCSACSPPSGTRSRRTARRVRQRFGAVAQWTVAMEYRADNPCPDTVDPARADCASLRHGPAPGVQSAGKSSPRSATGCRSAPASSGHRVGCGSSVYRATAREPDAPGSPRPAGKAAERRRNRVRHNRTWRTSHPRFRDRVFANLAGCTGRTDGAEAAGPTVPRESQRACVAARPRARDEGLPGQSMRGMRPDADDVVPHRTDHPVRASRRYHQNTSGTADVRPSTRRTARPDAACRRGEGWQAAEMPSVSLTIRFLAVCRECGDERLAVRMVAAGRTTGELGLPQSDDWKPWNATEMRAAIDYLERKRV